MSVIEKLNPEESFWSQLEDIPETLFPNNFSMSLNSDEYYVMKVRKDNVTHVFTEQPKVGEVGYKREFPGVRPSTEIMENDKAVNIFNALLN